MVTGHSNVKIGRDVRKGHLKGYWIYTLSLEERATCPSSCHHWANCYGNHMPYANRIDHTDPAFLPALEANIERLLAIKGRRGLLIRLHALGDFYSGSYVRFWRRMLASHPRLAIYGYSARKSGSLIGVELVMLNEAFPDRAMIRFSNGGDWRNPGTVTIRDPAQCPADAFVCPEQTGKTSCCATCGACWGTTKNVAFLEH